MHRATPRKIGVGEAKSRGSDHLAARRRSAPWGVLGGTGPGRNKACADRVETAFDASTERRLNHDARETLARRCQLPRPAAVMRNAVLTGLAVVVLAAWTLLSGRDAGTWSGKGAAH